VRQWRRYIVATAAFMTLAALGSRTTDVHATAGARWSIGHISAASPDPCGFRSRVWPKIQYSASLIATVQNEIDGKGGNLNWSDMTYIQTYLRDMVRDMASDYGKPNGWLILDRELAAVAGQLRAALYDWESYNSSGPVNTVAVIHYPQDMTNANGLQSQSWATIKNICPGGGKSRTNVGLINYYSVESSTTEWFTAPAKWSIVYHYDCSGLRDYSDGNGGRGQFLLTVRTAGNNLVQTAANESGKTAWGQQHLSRPGRFYLKVDTACYWHLIVHPY